MNSSNLHFMCLHSAEWKESYIKARNLGPERLTDNLVPKYLLMHTACIRCQSPKMLRRKEESLYISDKQCTWGMPVLSRDTIQVMRKCRSWNKRSGRCLAFCHRFLPVTKARKSTRIASDWITAISVVETLALINNVILHRLNYCKDVYLMEYPVRLGRKMAEFKLEKEIVTWERRNLIGRNTLKRKTNKLLGFFLSSFVKNISCAPVFHVVNLIRVQLSM
jgi:hypothetical protein